jgi:RHS repeat-associated protein
MTLAYNASGLRVKKYYNDGGSGGLQGAGGTMFMDQPDDLGMKAQDSDTTYNKGRDIDKIWFKNTANNYEFTIANKYLFDNQNKIKMFITLDVDTIENSGRLTLPEDTLTRVPKKAAWEYCLYIADNEYGYYTANGIKHSMPFGLAVNKVFGDSGKITIRLSKQVFKNIPAIRYTVSTFIPNATNTDSSWQGGSSAADVWPGSNETFAGEINGYGQVTPSSITSSTIYTIFYLYNGIEPIVEYAPDGSILNRYIYAGNMHIARINGADTNYYHCDALGSIRRVSNESGTAVWGGTYYPFGEMSGNGGNVHGFTGKEFDSEMGLNYFCQRYYDPEIGRFMELDQIPSQNRYAYCLNNPLIYTDPLGLIINPYGYMDWKAGVYRGPGWNQYLEAYEIPGVTVEEKMYLPVSSGDEGTGDKPAENSTPRYRYFGEEVALRNILNPAMGGAGALGYIGNSNPGLPPAKPKNPTVISVSQYILSSANNPSLIPMEELTQIKKTFEKFKKERPAFPYWGPIMGFTYITTWYTGVYGSSCGDYALFFIGYVYKNTNLKLLDVKFLKGFGHARVGVYIVESNILIYLIDPYWRTQKFK